MPAISTGSGGKSEMNIKIKAGALQKEGDLIELIGKKADKEEL